MEDATAADIVSLVVQEDVTEDVVKGLKALEANTDLDRFVELVSGLAAPLGSGDARRLLGGEWLGHALHPAVVQLPIGFWTSAFVLDVAGVASKHMRRHADLLVALGVASVPLAAASGLSDYTQLDKSSDKRVGAVHAAANVTASLAYLRSLQLRITGRRAKAFAWSLVGMASATGAAYLGGHLVYGSNSSDD